MMKLSVSGERIVTVADIVADEHLELVNKDLVRAHLSEGGKLENRVFRRIRKRISGSTMAFR